MKRLASGALFAALAVPGCSGGSSNPAPAALPAATAAPSSAKTSVTFTIAIPKPTAGSAGRRREYVSANTQSIVIQQLSPNAPYEPVGNPAIANVTPTSQGCASNSIQTTCTLNFPVAAGTFNFSIQTYAGLNGSGALLAENTLTTATIVVNVANALSVTLNGVIASVSAPSSVSGTLSVPQIIDFSASDATGATIVGSGTYDNGPLTVADTSGLVTLTPASFAGPSDSSSFSLQCNSAGNGSIEFADSSGALWPLSYSCSASNISLSPGNLDFDALAANPSDPTYDQIVTVTDENPNVTSQTPVLSCTAGQGSAGGTTALAMSPSAETWAIRPIDVGTCTFAVLDQFSDGGSELSQTIPIEIHATNYSIQSRARERGAR
jgi:hypothetical protein